MIDILVGHFGLSRKNLKRILNSCNTLSQITVFHKHFSLEVLNKGCPKFPNLIFEMGGFWAVSSFQIDPVVINDIQNFLVCSK